MKVSEIKTKVAAKVAKGKAKVAKKCGRAGKKCAGIIIACLLSLTMIGCQNPAQRAQTAETNIYVYEGATVNFGSDFVSLAQSNETGGNDAGQVASPTNDIKPDINVTVPVNKANTGTTSSAVGAAEKLLNKGVDALTDSSSTDIADCPDGSCTPPDSACTDGSCTPPDLED